MTQEIKNLQMIINSTPKLIALTGISLFFINNVIGQTNLTVTLDSSFISSKMMVSYFDGATFKFYTPNFTDNKVVIQQPIQSRYARIGFLYPNRFGNMGGIVFLINNQTSTIRFKKADDSLVNKLSNYEVKNLIKSDDPKVYSSIKKFTKKELKEYQKSSDLYARSTNDTTVKKLNETYEKLAVKELDFIKRNGKEYIYFEKFIQDIVPSLRNTKTLELYEVFNTAFPDSLKNLYEGKAVKTLLEGNLFVKIGMQCPQFTTIDHLGRELSSANLKGKYYLLSFWATWCGPCIKEIPQLKKIRTIYSAEQLSIVSISRDTDSLKFVKGIRDYKMNWSHVYNSSLMNNLFGDKPIPALYLLDKNGKIIFSSWEKGLPELEAIIKKELN